MGDRHGGRFARRGRTLNPSRPQVDAHHGVGLRWRARAKEFAPREKALLGEGLPTRRTSEGICPTRERSPRRRHPDTAHERKDLPRARTRPSAKVSRHGAKAKGFARARRLSSAKASRHGAKAKGFARAGTRPTAKASRHGARAKEFAPRRNTPLGEGLPTRRTGERICPARKRSPRRRLPDTAHERKDLPARGSRSPHVPTNGGLPSVDGQPEKHTFGGVAPERARPLPSSFTEKK